VPAGIAKLAKLGTNCVVFVADFGNNRVRMLVPSTCP
jgi:hypothetical protein